MLLYTNHNNYYYIVPYNIIILVIVPSPKVTIVINLEAQNNIVYAGDNVTLTCDVEASSIIQAANNNISVHITLEGPSGVVLNDTYDIHNDATVTTSVTLVSLMPSDNSELYACKAIYATESDIPYVTFEEGSDSVIINVTGK